MATNRTVTDEQFSDGTSIDGNRLDRALEDLTRFANKTPREGIRSRWVQNQFVLGWQPQDPRSTNDGTPIKDTIFPWMHIRNSPTGNQFGDALATDGVTGDGPPTGFPLNEWRVKGTNVRSSDYQGIVPVGRTLGTLGAAFTEQAAWTTSFRSTKPMLLHGFFLLLRTDPTGTVYENDFKYGAREARNGSYIDDLIVQIAVANPFGAMDRSLDNVEWSKYEFSANAMKVSNQATAPTPTTHYTDATPALPQGAGGPPWGLLVQQDDLVIPLHEGAIVEVRIVIPVSGSGVDGGWNEHSTGTNTFVTFYNQSPNLTITVLEELEGDADESTEVTRSRLARGTNLVPGHVNTPYTTIENKLRQNGDSVIAEQVAQNLAPFRVNLWCPVLDGGYIEMLSKYPKYSAGSDNLGWGMPFLIPPPQDMWRNTGVTQPDDFQPELTEIMLSFDQRGEPCAITGVWFDHSGLTTWGGTAWPRTAGGAADDEGRCHRAHVDRLNLKLAIFEKTPLYFDGVDAFAANGATNPVSVPNGDEYRVDDAIVSIDIPYTFFSNLYTRDNPFVLDGINTTFDPYKTYLAMVYAEELFETPADNDHPEHLALPNLLVSLRFRARLMPRDTGSGVQNIPSDHDGASSGPASGISAIVPPTDNTAITADSQAGVQLLLTNLDAEYRKGLRGGYTWWSGNKVDGNALSDDAAYEVIAVPMWAGQPKGQVDKDTLDADVIAYGRDGTGDIISTRQIVPLAYPLTIQHVFAVVQFQTNDQTLVLPAAAAVNHNIGVSIGSGFRSDLTAYTDVALLNVNYDRTGSSTYRAALVDQIGYPGANNPSSGSAVPIWDVLAVPLVDDGSRVVKGYFGTSGQGDPFFAGKGISPTFARRNVGNAVGGGGSSVAPPTAGQEQFIEVRWKITSLLTPESAWTNLPANTVVMGYQGSVVYLICKKHLV